MNKSILLPATALVTVLLFSGCLEKVPWLEQRLCPQAREMTATAYFCPEDECAAHLIALIDSANTSVHAAVYSFTLDPVADALIRAKERGVDVKVVVEKDQLSEYSEYERLKGAGVEVRVDSNPASMHNKFAVIDGRIVVTGSFNWSRNADQRNDENMLGVRSGSLAFDYEKEFQEIFGSGAVH